MTVRLCSNYQISTSISRPIRIEAKTGMRPHSGLAAAMCLPSQLPVPAYLVTYLQSQLHPASSPLETKRLTPPSPSQSAVDSQAECLTQ